MLQEPEVILVNSDDQEIGKMSKQAAHLSGNLHRAFSVFLFNDDGEWLLQKRAATKYHSAGLITNSCCSHPNPGESNLEAACRRLMEEMGIETELFYAGNFLYRAELDNGLIEHELDHLFVGTFNGTPQPNPEEVESFLWMEESELRAAIALNPQLYTYWFKLIFERISNFRKTQVSNTH